MIVNTKSIFSESNLSKHLDEHKSQYLNDTRFKDLNDDDFAAMYNTVGDKLSKQKVGKSNSTTDRYIGYINKRGCIVKYDTKFYDFLIYDSKVGNIVTLHKKNRHYYDNALKRDYSKELDYNK